MVRPCVSYSREIVADVLFRTRFKIMESGRSSLFPSCPWPCSIFQESTRVPGRSFFSSPSGLQVSCHLPSSLVCASDLSATRSLCLGPRHAPVQLLHPRAQGLREPRLPVGLILRNSSPRHWSLRPGTDSHILPRRDRLLAGPRGWCHFPRASRVREEL